MKAKAVLDAADELCANPFSTAVKVRELNNIEWRIKVDVLGQDPDDVEPILAANIATTDLELAERYQEVYISWLKTKYYWTMGEYDIYQNEKAMFDTEWNRWYADVCNERYTGSCAAEAVYVYEEESDDVTPNVSPSPGDGEPEEDPDENPGDGET